MCEKEGRIGKENEKAGRLKHDTLGFGSEPVQYQVLCKDELAGAVDGPPDESDHQHLQPGALQQLHLVMEGQLQESWK